MYSDLPGHILVPLLLLSACSVKEDRDACPCNLFLGIKDLPVSPVVVEVTDGDFAFTRLVHADTVLAVEVPKGELTVSVVGGALADPGGGVRIPPGEEAPPLYLFHAVVPADSEEVFFPVRLLKQFCTLELLFKGPSGYGPPFEVEVTGNVGGWNRDGSPAEGAFSKRLLPGSDGRAVLRLPRQGDDSLLMHIVFSDRVIRTFALGTYISESGYDWTAPELEDLTLKVDISLTAVTISGDRWTATEEIDLWI